MAINIKDHRFTYHRSGGHTVVFEAANQDTTDAAYHYFGYVSSAGSWLVQRFHIIASAIIYEYYAGRDRADYDVLWDANGIYVGALTFTTFDDLGI